MVLREVRKFISGTCQQPAALRSRGVSLCSHGLRGCMTSDSIRAITYLARHYLEALIIREVCLKLLSEPDAVVPGSGS